MALSYNPVADAPAQPASFLQPAKALTKCDGKDIVKRGHRKTKYLFAFSGLVTPVGSGRIGELAQLDSKNPVLYINFPQGRLKFFGTIVYPKNKYLTLHFQRGAGNILCEDCFESLVVFSTAWWIGTKDENPEEKQLEMPLSLNKEQSSEQCLPGGAGQSAGNEEATPAVTNGASVVNISGPIADDDGTGDVKFSSPQHQRLDEETNMDAEDDPSKSTPIRLSARTAGRKLNYVEVSSDEEELSDNGDDLGISLS